MIIRTVIKNVSYFALAVILSCIFISNAVSAETKTFIKEYAYQASEFDSKASSRTIALEQVKRLLLEELGTYLESKTEVINFQITKDQITALTAGIVKTEIVTEKWDGKTYQLVAKIMADPDEVVKSVDILRKDREKTQELEEIRKKADNALKEVEKLKRELEVSKKNKEKIAKYEDAVQELNATDLIEQGVALSKEGRFIDAIPKFTEAIKINPKYLWAYYHRGITYNKLSRYKQAISDFTQVMEIDPSFSWAYYNRGLAYNKIGNKQQGLNDIKKAAQIGDRFARNYLDARRIKWSENEKVVAGSAIPNSSNAYITSKYSKIFHRADCKWAKKILPKNRIIYKNREDAEKSQKMPCTVCNP